MDIKNSPNSDNYIFKDDDTICNICFEENNLCILQCCNNSKKICYHCLGCLKTPLCPWCRQELPSSIFPNSKKPQSYPNSYSEWVSQESRFLLINPHDPELRDSRILRRTMRNIRRSFQRSYSVARENRQERRNQRHQLRDYTRRVTQEFNRNNNDLTNINIFDMDDDF